MGQGYNWAWVNGFMDWAGYKLDLDLESYRSGRPKFVRMSLDPSNKETVLLAEKFPESDLGSNLPHFSHSTYQNEASKIRNEIILAWFYVMAGLDSKTV